MPNALFSEGFELAENFGLTQEGRMEAGANFHEETVGLGAGIKFAAGDRLAESETWIEELNLAQASAPNEGARGKGRLGFAVD
jgi:hypothetical protein